jgi:hypothetical protein
VCEELALPAVPGGFDELLRAFWQLRNRAGGNGFGLSPITHEAVCSWQQLYRVELLPFEVDLLFELDQAALAEIAENGEKK